jgi:hypothetical protein
MTIRCMSEGRSLYRINDKNPGDGCHELKHFIEADHWNYQEWGIFWTVNSFNGPRRKENCTKVLAWAVDMDDGSKAEQLARIRSIPLQASVIYETARGHHVYFDAIDGDPENYRDIVERLVEAYGGDKNAKDLCRILRVPGYLHWKGEKPFGIKCVHLSHSAYTEKEMREAFPREEKAESEFEQKNELRHVLRHSGGGDLWERIWNMDCHAALERLSGRQAVHGEQFTFRKNANGNLNIHVNGKGTSCWVDRSGRIGSHDKGGPTIFQWVNWYQKNPKATLQVLKDIFPELCK